MKKVNSMLTLGVVALMGVFSSCSKDTSTVPAPTVTFTVAGTQTTSVNVTSGQAINYTLPFLLRVN